MTSLLTYHMSVKAAHPKAVKVIDRISDAMALLNMQQEPDYKPIPNGKTPIQILEEALAAGQEVEQHLRGLKDDISF